MCPKAPLRLARPLLHRRGPGTWRQRGRGAYADYLVPATRTAPQPPFPGPRRTRPLHTLPPREFPLPRTSDVPLFPNLRLHPTGCRTPRTRGPLILLKLGFKVQIQPPFSSAFLLMPPELRLMGHRRPCFLPRRREGAGPRLPAGALPDRRPGLGGGDHATTTPSLTGGSPGVDMNHK